jgi:hypothetical protein
MKSPPPGWREEQPCQVAQAPLTRVHTTTLRSGIQPSPEFGKKGLASYVVNVGTKCGPRAASSSTAPAELDPGAVPHGELRALRRC